MVPSDAPASPSERAGSEVSNRRYFPTVWWISPAGAVLLVVPATLWLAWHLSDVEYRLLYGSPKVLTYDATTLFLAGALAFVLGAVLARCGRAVAPSRGPLLDLSARRWELLERAAGVLFVVTMVGYATWTLSAVRHGLRPAALIGAFTSSSPEVKGYFVTVPGITTLTQVGMPFVIVAILLILHRRHDPRLVRRLALLILITVLRSYLLDERLALIEIAVPAAVLLAAHAARSERPSRRTLANAAPLLLIPLLIVGFGAFEYSRSWQFYKSRVTESYPQFTINRLAGYYVTAYNNADITLEYQTYPGRVPYGSIASFWEAPVISQLGLYQRLNHGATSPVLDVDNPILFLHGNPEYNSPGGLGVPFQDYGEVGGLLFFLAAGFAIGRVHRAFIRSSPTAVLFYPILATGLFELPRYLYWSQGRVTPALVAAGVVAYVVRDADRRDVLGGEVVPA
jgi:uncharacterized membrane protein